MMVADDNDDEFHSLVREWEWVYESETSAGGFSRQLLSSVTNTLRCPHKYTAPVIHNEM